MSHTPRPRLRPPRGRRARAARLFVEPLEDRCVPATPVTGPVVEDGPDPQVAAAPTAPTSPVQDQNNASQVAGVANTLPPAAPAAADAAPSAVDAALPEAGVLPGDGQSLVAQQQSLGPFLTTVAPAFVSNVGPQLEDGVLVSTPVPDQASIGFVGRLVFPDTDLTQRANLPDGPFEPPLLAFPRLVADTEPAMRPEPPGARPAAAEDARPGAAPTGWLDLAVIVPGLPEPVGPLPAMPEGAPPEPEEM